MNNAIAILAKVPIPGFAKTRLSPPFTLKQSAQLSLAFLKDTLRVANKIKQTDVFVYYAPKTKKNILQRLLGKVELKHEKGKSLGEKTVFILHALFKAGYQNVLIVPADCPDMPEKYFQLALKVIRASHNTVVIGPSSDGALNLVGVNINNKGAMGPLRAMDWDPAFSVEKVIQRLKRAKITVYLLPAWHDIDVFADTIGFLKRNRKKKTHTGALLNKYLLF